MPLGLVLATLVILLSSAIAGEQYLVWGWRLPFLLASVMFVIGIYVRRFSTETSEFQTARAERSVGKIPLLEILQRYPVILTTEIYMVNQANFYITVVFIVSYAVGTLRVPFQTMLIATTIASFVQVFALAGFGALSDRVGRIPLMMGAAVGLLIIVFPLFAVIQTKDGVLISIALTVALIVNAAFLVPLLLFMRRRSLQKSDIRGYHSAQILDPS